MNTTRRLLHCWIVPLILALIVPGRAMAAEPAFTCVLTSDRTTYRVGETPVLSVRILNKSSAEVRLVGSLDGSSDGRRFPKCHLEILDAAGKPLKERAGFCGNMNPLRTADFVTVPAGGEFSPWGEGFFSPPELHHFPVKEPGTYTVRFHYSTAAKGLQDYFGDERMNPQRPVAPGIMRFYKQVPSLDLHSNDLILTFTAQ